jgi:hypothetical protein
MVLDDGVLIYLALSHGEQKMKPVVTEQTGKKYKGLMLIATLICCVSIVLMVSGAYPGGSALSFAAGIALFILARFAAWWNHG